MKLESLPTFQKHYDAAQAWPIVRVLVFVHAPNGEITDAEVVDELQQRFVIGILSLKWKERS